MRTIQMTLDDDLVKIVDRVARETRTSRSAFTRDALRRAIHQINIRKMEQRHRQGYSQKPGAKGEFDVWTGEQKWGDE